MSVAEAKPGGSGVEQELSMPYLYCSMPVKQLIRPPVKGNRLSYWLQPLALGLLGPLRSCSNYKKDHTFLFFVGFFFYLFTCTESRVRYTWPTTLTRSIAAHWCHHRPWHFPQISLSGQWRWTFSEVKALTDGWVFHLTHRHSCWTLCLNFLVFWECFRFTKDAPSNNSQVKSFTPTRYLLPQVAGQSTAIWSSQWVGCILTKNQSPQGCDQRYCSPLGGHCCMYMSGWMNGKSVHLWGETNCEPVVVFSKTSEFAAQVSQKLLMSFGEGENLCSIPL